MSRWGRSFFGLHGKEYFYEEIYGLVRHCGISYTEAWSMPISVRHWWIARFKKEQEKPKPEDRPIRGPIPEWVKRGKMPDRKS